HDFSPVTLATSAPLIVAVHPSTPAKSIKELIALAKARPGDLNYSTAGTGGAPHLATELFKSMAGVNIVRIPYKASSMALTAVLSGEVQLSFFAMAQGLAPVKAGKLRALAVTSSQPSLLAPGLRTVASSGLPGYESVGMYAFFMPAKTPLGIIDRVNGEI